MEPLFELKVSTAAAGSREVAGHLFRQLKDAILDQRLPPGSRLPSTRSARRILGVSRNTALDVYERLAQEDLVRSKHGSGTFVRERRDDRAPGSAPADVAFQGQVAPIWERPDTNSWIGFWHEGRMQGQRPIVADLRPALVDQRLFPHATFRQVMARQLRRLETNPASSRSPQRNQGNHQLRREIADHIATTRAIACKPDDVVVTSGAQQAFDLIARALVVPGKTVVAVEDPGYPPLRVPFAAAGARLVPVPVDGEGLIVGDIPPDAAIVCITPSHQFPLGMPMSPRRRDELFDFARRHGAVIVEDDYDGEFRYDGSPLEALRGRISADHVIYVGSFSKCMFPAIRLGFMISPQWARPALVAAKNAADWHCSTPIQTAVAGFIHDGHLTRHIRKVRKVYRERRERLVDLIDQRLGGMLIVVPSFYGMHVSVVAADDLDCDLASEVLTDRGIMIHSLNRYFFGPATRAGFIIGYAAADTDALGLAVDELAGALRKQRAGPKGPEPSAHGAHQ